MCRVAGSDLQMGRQPSNKLVRCANVIIQCFSSFTHLWRNKSRKRSTCNEAHLDGYLCSVSALQNTMPPPEHKLLPTSIEYLDGV
jgi:hypothetical protein